LESQVKKLNEELVEKQNQEDILNELEHKKKERIDNQQKVKI